MFELFYAKLNIFSVIYFFNFQKNQVSYLKNNINSTISTNFQRGLAVPVKLVNKEIVNLPTADRNLLVRKPVLQSVQSGVIRR